MAIIVVGGSTKGAGKTTLICGLIAALPEFRWNAVKITTHAHDDYPPIWEEKLPGTDSDTARYLAAGALRAFLATPPIQRLTAEPDLPMLLDQLWPNFGRRTNLIFESNSVVHHVRPDLCLMIHASPKRELPLPERKPSFLAALNHADALVAASNADRVIPDGLCLPGQAPKPVFHLATLARVSPQMMEWIRPLLGLATHLPARHDPFPHS